MWEPAAVVLTLHHTLGRSTPVQELYTCPLYLKGKTQSPCGVEQEGRVICSGSQEESEVASQSPHLLVTTAPALSTWVAHHGTGESE